MKQSLCSNRIELHLLLITVSFVVISCPLNGRAFPVIAEKNKEQMLNRLAIPRFHLAARTKATALLCKLLQLQGSAYKGFPSCREGKTLWRFFLARVAERHELCIKVLLKDH
jgi:hypothetical protein